MVKIKMNNWQTKKLGKLLELCDSGTWGEESSKGMPLLRSSNMQDGQLILDDLKLIDVPTRLKDRFTLREGDILITKSSGSEAHIGKSLYIDSEIDGLYGFSNFTQRLRPNKKLVEPFFLYLLISSPSTRKKLLNSSRTTSGLRNLSIPILKAFEIPIPPISTQRIIVEKLDVIRKLQELNNKEIKKAEELFNSFVTNQLVVSKDIKLHKFDDIAKFQYGLTAEGKDNGNYRLVRITDIDESGQLRNIDKKFVTIEEKIIQPYTLKSGDLVVARTGATYGKFLLFDSLEPSVFASYLIKITFNPKLALSRFVWLFTRTESYWIQARKLVTGSGQPQFNANRIKQIEITLPSLNEQKEIIAKAEYLLNYSNILTNKKKILNELFESTLNKLMKPN
ncbi:MAG: hypothetical protein UR23_C0006G0004 [Candidatus Roizmanbacteria bacterium GW2011_GWA2_32_13]|uniref:Type I restriction modification DNA specificity domain-containing protein n=1 Tax=Candidatus Roizmanbacteria bacterium GW2011_GWA2_32_13 TaxID=1618475 RepID=A0A0G0C1P3_9BACT|nr:MAG: hypothetical protein UR23_C0006G0004 [Candidatus Roizmanbacteria bacterium GW2011_GWA2_32_13]